MQYPAWVRQPFSYDTTTADITSPYTNDIIELQESEVKNATSTQQIFKGIGANKSKVILLFAKVSLEVLMSFVTTYLCEYAFSILVDVKAKKRNRLACENDMKIAASETKPRISQLVTEKQHRSRIDIEMYYY